MDLVLEGVALYSLARADAGSMRRRCVCVMCTKSRNHVRPIVINSEATKEIRQPGAFNIQATKSVLNGTLLRRFFASLQHNCEPHSASAMVTIRDGVIRQYNMRLGETAPTLAQCRAYWPSTSCNKQNKHFSMPSVTTPLDTDSCAPFHPSCHPIFPLPPLYVSTQTYVENSPLGYLYISSHLENNILHYYVATNSTSQPQSWSP